MKHNIKHVNGTRTKTFRSPTRMIGVRLPPDEYAEVQKIAVEQERSVASLARICLRIGLEQMKQSGEG